MLCVIAIAILAVATGPAALSAAEQTPCSRPAPAEVTFTATLGAVVFPHELHTDMEVPCADCHHDTRAASLEMPHPDYFEDFWIRCETCHRVTEEPGCPQTCSTCHHGSPATIADQTLSSKVVIHQACWECHPAGTGAEASRSCEFCHQQDVRNERG